MTETTITSTQQLPRVLIIGAGSRGNAYSKAICASGLGVVVAVADTHQQRRRLLGSKYIWKGESSPRQGQEFTGWKDYVAYEHLRRSNPDEATARWGLVHAIDTVFVCVLDEMHLEVVNALAPLGLHIMCEKPLATTLDDCLSIYATLLASQQDGLQTKIFGIGHVLRYSPHNMLLRELVLENRVVGDILSVEHTEPVGWRHFSHSYVRGNWRRESSTAPSLLTKSCHDIDWLLWMMCSPPKNDAHAPHLPSFISSTGSLNQFRRSRKPAAAGSATNCLSCPLEKACIYSATRIYYDHRLAKGQTGWPVKIVNSEIEECYQSQGPAAAKNMLMRSLSEDYDATTALEDRLQRPWYGRCVWDADNDVCDDQFVTMTWEDQVVENNPSRTLNAKTATFHMIAGTEKTCERRGWIYGDKGEIEYDSSTIKVFDFDTDSTKTYNSQAGLGGHGGGDAGLACQFLKSVVAVDSGAMTAEQAQAYHLGCTTEEVIRSHAMVFAADQARKEKKIIDWLPWWNEKVEAAQAANKAGGLPTPPN